jgi:hypothetical protein
MKRIAAVLAAIILTANVAPAFAAPATPTAPAKQSPTAPSKPTVSMFDMVKVISKHLS